MTMSDVVKMKNFNNKKVMQIKKSETYELLKKVHYAKRIPSISYAFGLYEDLDLIGVITYGSPPSSSLCVGICGEKFKHHVIELNRLCLIKNNKNNASYLVGNSLKLLPNPKIVVSYADTSMNHTGYIYQATNFIYTGLSDKRTEWRIKNSNMHSKTICEKYTLEERKSNTEKFEVVDRPRKHRYIYFVGDKKQKRELFSHLKYEVSPYPKTESLNYKVENQVKTQMILEGFG
jgi:hypothetical protein